MITAIIFDCFGVLLTDAFDAILREFQQRQPEAAAKVLDLAQDVNRGLITRDQFVERISVIMEVAPADYNARITNGEIKNKDLFAYIKQLRRGVKTAVLSNVSYEGFWRRFTPNELRLYFDATILSGEIGYAKPDAQAYEVAAEQLGVRLDECVMIDDREDYCAGARAVGMQAIVYQSLPQLKSELEKFGVAT